MGTCQHSRNICSPAKSGMPNQATTTSGPGTTRVPSADSSPRTWSDYFDPVPYANLENPQTLNLYSYVQNNPLSRSDATGHYSCAPDTVSTNANGDTVVTAGACHFDLSDLPQMAVAVGHHFLSQRMFQNWDPSSYAYKVANNQITPQQVRSLTRLPTTTTPCNA